MDPDQIFCVLLETPIFCLNCSSSQITGKNNKKDNYFNKKYALMEIQIRREKYTSLFVVLKK